MSDSQNDSLLDDAIQAFREKLNKTGGRSEKFDGIEKQNQDKWEKALRDQLRKRP